VACLYVGGERVNLRFFRCAELDDPTGWLAGSGGGMRHVEVAVPSDIKRRELANLLGGHRKGMAVLASATVSDRGVASAHRPLLTRTNRGSA
jgi:hypothetical protein